MTTHTGAGGVGLKPMSAAHLSEQCFGEGVNGQELLVAGKKIVGSLDFAGKLIKRPLRFTQCEFTGPVDLTGAQAAAEIHFAGCTLDSLVADRLTVHGDLVLEKVQVRRGVSVCGARVGGHLRCSGSTFNSADGRPFNAKGMIVGGSALFDDEFVAEGEFTLSSARISGSVDLTGATFRNAAGIAIMAEGIFIGVELILADEFTAEGTVSLRKARIGGDLKCSGGTFTAVHGDKLALDAELIRAENIFLDDADVTGRVRLDAGIVTGRVSCSGATVTNHSTAFEGNGTRFGELRLGAGFEATGEVRLIGAIIDRELNCSNGSFDGGGGPALLANGLQCRGRVFFNEEFTALGEVSLLNARIETELNCSNGTFRNPRGRALAAGGLVCNGSVFINEKFTAEGTVELADARVARELKCNNGTFDTLEAERLNAGVFDWTPGSRPKAVNVRFADVGLLRDTPLSWPSGTRLTGFTFQAVEGGAERERETWLGQAEQFAPDVYQQLVQIFRRTGRSRQSQDMDLACRRDQRERGRMPRPAKLWSWFLDWSVRYGYSLYRPVWFVVGFGLLGILWFYLAASHHLMEPVNGGPGAVGADANRCTAAYPCFMPVVYSYELFLPIINFRQVNYWLPDAATGWGKVLFIYVWFAIASGWVVCTAIAAGIGQLFSRRN